MLTHAVPHRLTDAGRLASARNWRTQAELLRDGAEARVLTTGQRTVLLRDAKAAERQARRRLRATRTRGRGPDQGPRPSAAPDRHAVAQRDPPSSGKTRPDRNVLEG